MMTHRDQKHRGLSFHGSLLDSSAAQTQTLFASPQYDCDVAIIGGGPAGLSAAIELKKSGIHHVVVLERESDAGGVPRHCDHSLFGFREFRRCFSGPRYAQRLTEQARKCGVDIHINTSVIALHPNAVIQLSTPGGVKKIRARKALISTGARETPRSARLISGRRPAGITTTGALQSTISFTGKKPFQNPVVIGSELVAFSSLLTCKFAGIQPVAMIEENPRITAWSSAVLLPKIFGVPLYTNTRLVEISGKQQVSSIRIRNADSTEKQLDCDGVIFTGHFIPEATLIRSSHLQFDKNSGGPVIDQYGRCSDSDYFATGNLLHPVETAGWCWAEGKQVAKNIKDSLNKVLPNANFRIPVHILDKEIHYITPQVLTLPRNGQQTQKFNPFFNFQLRFSSPVKGNLSVHSSSPHRKGDSRCKTQIASRHLGRHHVNTEYVDTEDAFPLFTKSFTSRPERRALLNIPYSNILDNLNVQGEPGINKILIRFSDCATLRL
ncbi:MAG: FAD-dependent oxidoreductase [Gammaproteobacteria bacterium]|nr:FAD-dependent oxidoreductase [Gammaproteobacteria bacterium]